MDSFDIQNIQDGSLKGEYNGYIPLWTAGLCMLLIIAIACIAIYVYRDGSIRNVHTNIQREQVQKTNSLELTGWKQDIESYSNNVVSTPPASLEIKDPFILITGRV